MSKQKAKQKAEEALMVEGESDLFIIFLFFFIATCACANGIGHTRR